MEKIKGRNIFLTVGVLVLVVFGVNKLLSMPGGCRNFNEGTVLVNGQTEIEVALAVEAGELRKGLSGCESLDFGQGMYFVLPQEREAVFWMKDMVMPIDIVWISAGRVVGVEERVQPESGSVLTKYRSPVEVDAVLEVGSGHAVELGLKEGVGIEVKKYGK